MTTLSSTKRTMAEQPVDVNAWHRLKDLQRHISHAFDEMYERIGKHHHSVSGHVAANLHPETELGESSIGFECTMDAPGFGQDDLEVTVRDGRLKISGEKTTSSEHVRKRYLVQERRFGRFERTFRLSGNLDPDHAEATLENGTLRVTIPWQEGKAAAPNRIPIKGKKSKASDVKQAVS